MKSARRKFEEVTNALGIRRMVIRVYQATAGRKEAQAKERLREFYAPMLRSARLIFDIGANAGRYASVFASFGARVVALEPNPDCVRHIQLSYPDIEVIQAVAGPKDGLADLNLSDARDDISSLSAEWIAAMRASHDHYEGLWNRRLTVPMLRVDTLLEHYGTPDYIKIDVEGFEEGVLDGLSICPRLLSFEYNPTFLEATFRCLNKPMFAGAGFNFITQDDEEFCIKGEWVSSDDIKLMLPKYCHKSFGDIFVRKQ